MAQKTFLSPAVSTREIDLSQPSKRKPAGIPAGVIGTARRGPAFVPVTVATFQDFVSKFGNTDGEAFGPLAMHEWLRNAQAGTYVRVLGIGNAEARATSGKVASAGFVVGSQQVQANGNFGTNPYAHSTTGPGQLGRSFVLGCFMSESAGSSFLSDAGIQKGTLRATASVTILNAGEITNNAQISFVTAGGDTVTITGHASDNAMTTTSGASTDGTFAAGNTLSGDTAGNKAQALAIAAAISLHDDFTATAVDTNVITITQNTGGEAGNTTITIAKNGADGNMSADDIAVGDSFTAGHDVTAQPIVRGILMFPSGVVPTLNTSITALSSKGALAQGTPGVANQQEGIERGCAVGDIITGSGDKQEFVMLLNGHKVSDGYLNVITASFEQDAPNNFRNMFNTDPTKIEEAGHYLYQDYQIHKSFAVPTGSGATYWDDFRGSGQDDGSAGKKYATAFLLPSSGSRNDSSESSSTVLGNINLEGFEDRFRTAFSPFVVSQQFGGQNKNLFRIHALDDGQAGSDTFKITIENIIGSTNENRKFGSFDLVVRRFDDSDVKPEVLEKYNRIDLDPSSDRYIARAIGDTHTFYDFDKKAGAQKLVIDGIYPNMSQYIRVETSEALDESAIDDSALPVGFRGLYHMVTSGAAGDTGGLGSVLSGTLSGSGESARQNHVSRGSIDPDDHHLRLAMNSFSGSFQNVVQFPIPMRDNISRGSGKRIEADASLTWGIQFEKKKNLSEPNALEVLDESIRSFVRYLPHHLESDQNVWAGDNEGVTDIGGAVLDADRFNNNLFSLERIEVITDTSSKPDPQQWAVAAYRRDGTANSTMTDIFGTAGQSSRLIDPALDFAHLPSRKYLKFTFPLQGGFDGVNVFDKDKAKFRDNAVRREMDDSSNQGGIKGPTVAALRKAIDVMEEKSDVDIKVLATPGLRHESITDYAVESTERRFDALYIMDIEEKDTVSSYVTSSTDQIINVSNTVTRFANRNMDSSFGAAYFPDVVITDPSTKTNVQCPPSVAVLGALSYNDAIAHPWYAPAGFNRGGLTSVLESQVKLNQANLDELYAVDINPLASFGHTPEVVVYGQKTLLANKSSLDRVNVRRLLIEVRRSVRGVANTLLFEPNREDTLTKFSNAVTPILSRIQAQQGIERFKVQIDTTTTTQADVENNTIRGKIYLQPTRAVEFISLDFVVTNAGAEI